MTADPDDKNLRMGALPRLPAIFEMRGGPFSGERILLEDCPASAVFTYRRWTGRYLYDARTGNLRWSSHKPKKPGRAGNGKSVTLAIVPNGPGAA